MIVQLLCYIFSCYIYVVATSSLKHAENIKLLSSTLSIQKEYILDIKERSRKEKQLYFTDYLRNLFKEISLYDADKSLLTDDRTASEDVKTRLASVHILYRNIHKKNKYLFDISCLPRNLFVSHAELVTHYDTKSTEIQGTSDNYLIKDVTQDFKDHYTSGTDLYEADFDDNAKNNTTPQLVIFENVNNTLLSSLRSRRRRDISLALQMSNIKDSNINKKLCSLLPWEVNFRDIGWSRSLWHPSSYYANVCSGSCDYNDNATVYSSHAYIKNLFIKKFRDKIPNNFELSTNCSPSSYAPQTIIYLSKHRTIMVKQISRMKVASCSCL
ncbi:bone morphogenetic protein 15-like [Mytilus edulis]|uniref:bone morphogenetic protein 15-like n=1 Tax=Mytilus edulis TaxID=6550 RepID=UPI0039EE988B